MLSQNRKYLATGTHGRAQHFIHVLEVLKTQQVTAKKGMCFSPTLAMAMACGTAVPAGGLRQPAWGKTPRPIRTKPTRPGLLVRACVAG